MAGGRKALFLSQNQAVVYALRNACARIIYSVTLRKSRQD
jgi:hypothetical protein